MKKSPTLVILSGGMDSTVLAYHIKNSPQHELIGCVSVDYGQRHKHELLCAQRTCVQLDVPFHQLDLSGLGSVIHSSALTGDQPVPDGHYAEESMKATVVPNRNMILIALAVAVGITNKAERVAYGAHSGDHAIYPDCRPVFADALASAIDLCDYCPPTLIRPFIELTKADIVGLGLRHGVNFDKTWTCYKGVRPGTKPVACGRCGTCVERLEAFAVAGAEDPLEYADRDFWKTVPVPPGQTQLL